VTGQNIRLTFKNTLTHTHTQNMVRVLLPEYLAGQYKTYFINTSQSKKIQTEYGTRPSSKASGSHTTEDKKVVT
jgi:hypothetical protein